MHAVRELLPWWVEFGPLLYGAPFVLISVGLVWLSNRRFLAEAVAAPDEPWHVKAALVYRARVNALTLSAVCLLLPVVLGVARGIAVPSLFGRSQIPQWVLVAVLATLACRIFAARSLKPLRSPEILREGPSAGVAQFILMRGALVPMGLFMWLAAVLPPPWSYLSLVALVASVMLVSRIAFAVMKLVGIARPASDRLLQIVKRAQAQTGLPLREVVELPFHSANAFALPGVNVIGFTRSALAVLSDEELEVVAAHELDHLRRSRSFTITRILLLCALLSFAALLMHIIPFSLTSAFAVLLICIAVVVVNSRIRRSLEVHADHAGQHAQHGEAAYARALEKLYRVNRVPPVMGVRMRAHPELYDRMKAAGVDPGYERPKPLKPGRPLLFVFGLAGFIALMVVQPIVRSDAQSEGQLLSMMTITGGTPEELRELAWFRQAAGDAEAALAFAQAAEWLAPDDFANKVAVAKYELALGRCDRARVLTETSNRRASKKQAAQLASLRQQLADANCSAIPGE